MVAAHFVPSNLTAVHRSRLWSLHLREFGWEPIIVTAHWRHYEEAAEFELMELVPPDLKVIRTKALPTRPVRVVGDIGIRAFPWHYRALLDLASKGEIDFIHITIPSNYSALLGRLLWHKTGVPYGIDYIDPWVHTVPGSDRPFTKAWASARLAELFEPWAVKRASLITGINRRYFEGVLERNPHLRSAAVLAEMPYGGSEKDHEHVRANSKPARLFAAHSGKFNLIYAGAMLPKAYGVLDRLLDALALLRHKRPQLCQEFHLHFVGTGKSATDPEGFNILPYIKRFELEDCVSEYPQRLPYLEVLAHLDRASGILVLGSTEAHYSPSKVFQSVMARRPVLALLHKESTALSIMRTMNAGTALTFDDSLPRPAAVSAALEQFVYSNDYSDVQVRWEALDEFSARQSARVLAASLDEALLRNSVKQA